MNWWQGLLLLVGVGVWAFSLLAAFWLGAKARSGEKMQLRQPPPPKAIVDSPQSANAKRAALRQQAMGNLNVKEIQG